MKPNFILLFMNYLFALVINYLFYSLFYIDTLVVETYWVGYFSTLLLQSIICLVITYLDMQIKKGL